MENLFLSAAGNWPSKKTSIRIYREDFSPHKHREARCAQGIQRHLRPRYVAMEDLGVSGCLGLGSGGGLGVWVVERRDIRFTMRCVRGRRSHEKKSLLLITCYEELDTKWVGLKHDFSQMIPSVNSPPLLFSAADPCKGAH